jgi:hypothetical protein
VYFRKLDKREMASGDASGHISSKETPAISENEILL